ncbi:MULTISPECIES: hypothetical protein [Burkholderia]|uniref:hypothetical protein n=1 Tax=Burkholderia TaxID=32008 RepID=UPI00075B665B|nr:MULTISPECIES: hypothetical protein [Burkholderia]KVH68924.1 hypothetical protein WJ42_33510 [Burkholderia cepacia]KVS58161.1 hypothetical protein WK41_38395 [Burkholderia cepacia]KWC59057.1 hypothetical protein WL55_34010 [Burkholderia cepacia]KWD57372.1 hypothetical protein WL68_02515 [Burkholderia cepacia]KWD83110.1 hypothetical protein WL69_15700 [Burkholderia cepacia]
MRPALTEIELRATWRRLRMVGDYDQSMRRPAVRVAIESAARAHASRAASQPPRDLKRLASGDTDH